MREAIGAISSQDMSISKAAEVYGIPRSTLTDHVHGHVLPGSKSGAPTLLSLSDEQNLVEFLLRCSFIGYAKTRQDVLDIVCHMLLRRGIERTVTSGWWNKFLCCHPDLRLRTPATLSLARKRASTRECIDNYFDLLEETLQESGICDYPGLIYNMDESGFPLDPKPLKTVHRCGDKHPFSVSSGSKAQVTVAACISATGQSMSPLIVWKRKTMAPEMAHGEIPGTLYGFTEKGWMTAALFHNWFKKLFLRYAPASRPLILLLDGHSSHYCPNTIDLTIKNGIIMFALPPNTTHLTQPLDKGVFGPFKQHWRRVCHDYLFSHPGHFISGYNFSSLFSKAWLESMTTKNAMSGFETTGIYPTDRYAVQLPGKSDHKEKPIVPCLSYTPFKRCPSKDGLYSSGDISPLAYSRRSDRVTAIADLKTPEVKRVKPPRDGVITSVEFQAKLNKTAETEPKLKKSSRSKLIILHAILVCMYTYYVYLQLQ